MSLNKDKIGSTKEEIAEILKKNPLVRGYANPLDENKMCICGHEEKYHHNHTMADEWAGTEICRQCMMCPWTGEKQCYHFKELRKELTEK